MSDYHVYIMTNNSGTLYVGVTNNLERRVYYEMTPDVRSAIEREKEIKGWVRRKKIALIASANPYWSDLSEVWTGEIETLRGVYPEGCVEIPRFAQNDRERRAQGDR